ncbi:TRZ/ATZ family hydrolase [Reinekea marinisedimentorum]|uniref:5-methylthioadenosine/S-adenosylhomocysteine deaminase n=1 Tax=Reinekea marinisedimentorum TaxID=230495 RepID=A0A4R3I2J3_9GAMM|nr:TRZ/ATZ family hydrolase [Reinekea marinisedimentorum]TCS39987.1 5-methylthioadenosine/S-adenosylhomocysteine deaminase [Reinekea marinisedimentorum]
MQPIDTLINARWVIPVNKERDILENHSVAIADGKIVDILATNEAADKYTAKETISLQDQALIPGFVNTHGHAAMALFRGMADDLELMTWLNDHVWPAEGKWVSAEFVKDGTLFAAAEMIRSGTTTFSDNYFFAGEAAKSVIESGMRAQLCPPVLDFPTNWAQTPDEHIDLITEVMGEYKNHSHVRVVFGPHAPYTCSDEPLIRIKELADELNVPVQMHVHETQVEVDGQIEQRGNRPIRRLKELGLLNSKFQAVHMTALSDEDIDDIAEAGAHVLHCPESNLKLASGFCPVDKLQKRGINVALGTDGAASNNDLDMLGEMRTAAMLAKAVGQNAVALPAYEALAMATINGAKALGWDAEIGSLEVGKCADITAIALDDLESQPLYDPVSHIVYASTRDQVKHVWVNGKHLLDDRNLTTLDKNAIVENAKQWQAKIKG